MAPPQTTIAINGFAVREIRVLHRVSIRSCAQRAGIDRSYLAKLETGDRVNVSPEVLGRLLSALGIRERRAIMSHPGADTARDAALQSTAA